MQDAPGVLSDKVINVYKMEQDFWEPGDALSPVKFGTSGHRGKLGAGFSAAHARAIAQAVARLHTEDGIKGEILVGGDTRLMSRATAELCAEVLAGNGLNVCLAKKPLPTPVFSHEIISGRACASLNGTASHNPPDDMGLKYNPGHGGPAGSELTSRIERYANEFLKEPGLIKKTTLKKAREQGLLSERDLVGPYVKALGHMINFDALKNSGLRIGVHALGGSSVEYYLALAQEYGLSKLKVVDKTCDPTFGFIPLDHDMKIRMDPSSKYPLKPLLALLAAGKYDFAGASDPDADRFGAATRDAGLVHPNHALSIALDYLFSHRPKWPAGLGAGRTIGTTHLLDRICAAAGRKIDEVDVGFKYFVDGIRGGRYALAGEESAGLSLYGWTPEKDGILAVLLLAEVMAVSGRDLSQLYKDLAARHGEPSYRRVDTPVSEEARIKIKGLKASTLDVRSIAGEKVTRLRDSDGIKVYLEDSWLLARLSGTEPVVKLYAESFRGGAQLEKVLSEGAAALGIA